MRASHHVLPSHLLDPEPRDVPVVVHVVVVEDHRRRHGREQPADVRVRPRLAVEPRVLLEVGDLLAGLDVGAAPAPDELERLRRHLVRVHLVAEEQDRVGPLDLAALELLRVRPERIDPERLQLVGPGRREVGRLRIADTARAEDEPYLALLVARMDDGARPAVVGRPDELAVEPDVVRTRRTPGSRSSTRRSA